MKTVTVIDSGHVFTLLVHRDDLPDIPVAEEPAKIRFIKWWKTKCAERSIPYEYGIAEPQGLRIIANLLKRYEYRRLQELAIHLIQERIEDFRANPNHFILLATHVNRMNQEWPE